MKKERLPILASVKELVKNNRLDEVENMLREMSDLLMHDALINLPLSNTLKQNNLDTIYNLACILEAK